MTAIPQQELAVLAQIALALAPIKLLLAGVIFLVVAWYASKTLVAIAVGGVTAGEASVNLVREQMATWTDPAAFANHPIVSRSAEAAGLSVGGNYLLFALVANALLALAMFFAVHALKAWATLQTREREAAIERALRARRSDQHRPYP
jgi:hypothetical protein